MAVRSAQELLETVKNIVGDKEGVETLLEDITDSVTIDISDFVPKAEYEKIKGEAARATEQANSYRDKYINRFYSGYDSPDSKGYVMGGISQGDIETEEKWGDYENLFE